MVVGEAVVCHDGAVEVIELDDYVAVDLQVAFGGHFFAAHHVDKRLVPFSHLVVLLGGQVHWGDNVVVNPLYVKGISADDVLDLPHVEEVFGDVVAAFLRSYNHWLKVLRVKVAPSNWP